MWKALSFVLVSVSHAYGHCFINSVSGANGLSAVGLGVTTNGEVPRGGTVEQPFQLDTPVLKNLAADPCGATLLAGSVNIAKSMAAVAAKTGGQLPSIPSNGTLTMGVFQVNADGGGPFKAEINVDATGKAWQEIKVLSQPPGALGLLHNGPANSSITVQIPPNVSCTGGANKNACVIRLNNGGPNTGSVANGAGPFGGCVAVQQGGKKVAGGNGAAVKSGMKGKMQKRVYSRHFFPTRAARAQAGKDFSAVEQRELEDLLLRRSKLDSQILERRQKLTAQMIDELETATGTAIDIPIDALAGHVDEAALGGNSTTPKNAVLTTQQAVDLKKAVQNAIAQALTIMAEQGEVDAGKFGQSSKITDKLNAEANAAIASGQATSINAGNAGVGFFQTEVVNSLLGGLATATQGLSAFVTGTAAAVTSAASVPATTAVNGNGAVKGNHRNGNNPNRGN